jgi:hypothetical protein
MADDETRRLLKRFGVAVTDLEEAIGSGDSERRRQAAAELSERMRQVTELVERLIHRAAPR